MTTSDTISRERREYFDGLYRGEAEPWTYSARAAELLRHESLERAVRSLKSRFERVLDVGCSQGQLTARLVGVGITPAGARWRRRRWRPARGHVRGESGAFC